MKLTVNFIINTHKILVIPFVLFLMWYYDNWSAGPFLYLGLHGTYCLLWLLKQDLYPDKRFEQKIPLWIGLRTPFLPLAAYYMAPFLLISRNVILPAWIFAAAPAVYTLGIFMHYVSDAQKHYTLRLQKGIIDDGLFARTRNPNYLGEILIYASYALLSWHWLPFVILGCWTAYFFRNMRSKDRSMSRHAAFTVYKKRTGMLFPKLLR
ncbi:isoprenylcysteine carboxylmethyltransferase family protein [Flavobacterium sp. ACN6]|uniref:methyltransferase family protein n=1 Tax=Flavobacterium sp. ACN6 TaxID=1920426 RepID=UPI000BB34E53|nr:DUF1295 domain-containing protein [Flavobacterium sp. ACN6]PBJ07976.1 hypothetical protein BSF42_36930 [Flavobacterium sp. ACN6]